MDDDEKREAAISSVIAAASLKPKLLLNPSSSSPVTQSRISKFQELHNRRLQIKEKSKVKKNKSKGKSSRLQEKDDNSEECASECKTAQGTSTSISLDGQQDNVLSTTKDVIVPKKPQKLYWGLDTKERWERKSNM